MEELKKILKDTTKCALLDHYLLKSKNIAYLKFILEVDDYKQSYDAQDENWRQDLAQEILRRYIQKNAKNSIELAPSVIDDITKNIKTPKAEIFVSAYNSALRFMADNVFSDFVSSDIYKNYRDKKILPWAQPSKAPAPVRRLYNIQPADPASGTVPTTPVTMSAYRTALAAVRTRDAQARTNQKLPSKSESAAKNSTPLSVSHVEGSVRVEEDVTARVARAARTGQLDLRNCHLHRLPSELALLAHHRTPLRSVDLYRNLLDKVPAYLCELNSLTELTLSRNKLSVLSAAVAQLQQLKVLRVGSNQLFETHAALFTLTQLVELDLSNNHLAHLAAEVSQLRHLRELKLGHNHLKHVPVTVQHLTALRRLELQHNAIERLPPSLALLTELRVLHLDYNPLLSPPIALCARGRGVVLKYLRALLTAQPRVETLDVAGPCFMNGARVNSATTFELSYSTSAEVTGATPSVELIGPCTVRCEVESRGPQRYLCTFQTEAAGTYQLRVALDELSTAELEACLPVLHVRATECAAQTSHCTGLGTCVALVGEETQFSVVTRDQFDNAVQHGGAVLAVSVQYASAGQSAVDVTTLIEQVQDDEAWSEHRALTALDALEDELDESQREEAVPAVAAVAAPLSAVPTGAGSDESAKIAQTVRVTDLQTGQYAVSYTAHCTGKLVLSVQLLDSSGAAQHVFGSPFEVTAVSRDECHQPAELTAALRAIEHDIAAFTEQHAHVTQQLAQTEQQLQRHEHERAQSDLASRLRADEVRTWRRRVEALRAKNERLVGKNRVTREVSQWKEVLGEKQQQLRAKIERHLGAQSGTVIAQIQQEMQEEIKSRLEMMQMKDQFEKQLQKCQAKVRELQQSRARLDKEAAVRGRWLTNLLKESHELQTQLLGEGDVTRVALMNDKARELKHKLHEEESAHHAIDANKARVDSEALRVKAQLLQLCESVRALDAELRQAQTPEHWALGLERRYLGEHVTRVIEAPGTPGTRRSGSPTPDSAHTESPKSAREGSPGPSPPLSPLTSSTRPIPPTSPLTSSTTSTGPPTSPLTSSTAPSPRTEAPLSPPELAGTVSLLERKQQLFKPRDEIRAVYTERASINATLVPFREKIKFWQTQQQALLNEKS